MLSRVGTTLALLVAALLLAPLVVALIPTGAAPLGSAPPIQWHTLLASLAVASAAALLAVAIGGSLALVFSLTDFPAAHWWATCCLLPFLAPPTVWALAQVYCFGPGGLLEQWLGDGLRPLLTLLDRGHYLSTVLVMGQTYAPLAMFVVGRAGVKLSRSGFDAARMSLRGLRIVAWMVLAIRKELVCAFLLAFALGLGNFATPHVLQCRLYAIEIYMRSANYLDPQGAMLAALPLLAIATAAAFLFAWWEPAASESLAEAQRPARISLGSWKYVVGACVLGWLTLTIGLPIGATVVACGTPSQFLATAGEALPEVQSTLFIGVGAAAVACVAAGMVAGGLPRGAAPGLEALANVPLGVPAMVVGLAYAQFFTRTHVVNLTSVGDTSVLVILGLAFRSWPFATRILRNGLLRIPAAWLEAAQLANVSTGRRVWRIQLPLIADSLGAAAVLTFVIAVGDVEISQMLCAPGTGTLALRLFTFLHFGPTHVAASLCLLQLVIAVVPVAVYLLLFDRRPEAI